MRACGTRTVVAVALAAAASACAPAPVAPSAERLVVVAGAIVAAPVASLSLLDFAPPAPPPAPPPPVVVVGSKSRVPYALDRLDHVDIYLEDLTAKAPMAKLGTVRPAGDGPTGRVFAPLRLANLRPSRQYKATLQAFQFDPVHGAVVRVDDGSDGSATTFSTAGAKLGEANAALALAGGFALKLVDQPFNGLASGPVVIQPGHLADAGLPESVAVGDVPLGPALTDPTVADVGALRVRLLGDGGAPVTTSLLPPPLPSAVAFAGLRPGKLYQAAVEALALDGTTPLGTSLAVDVDLREDGDGAVPQALSLAFPLPLADRPLHLAARLEVTSALAADQVGLTLTTPTDEVIIGLVLDAADWATAGTRPVAATNLRPSREYKLYVRTFLAGALQQDAVTSFTAPALVAPMPARFDVPGLVLP